MSATILQTKLNVPYTHPNLVARSRLTERIESGVQAGHRLTLVAAPAGFGKTTAVSVWVNQSQQPVAWVSLEESDNEGVIFWRYVLAAIRTISPVFAENTFAALTTSPPPQVNSILPGFINELNELAQPVTLVLDDYHVIDNQEIHNSILFLLDHQPRHVHLIIATRSDPPLPTARLRAQRLLTELRTEDLRFTNAEARIFLNDMMGLRLGGEDINLLGTRTEGWAVGILLAAQSMQGKVDKREFIAKFSGSQRFVLEYLVEEVLKQQTKTARRFLLQTSILDRFCGPLCEAVTGRGDGEYILQQLRKDNLFIIPLDQELIWYRYHHLLADLLFNVLQREFAEEDILELHRRASRWFQGVGEVDSAVKYALLGQDFERAADLIEQIVDQVIARGQVKTLLGWLGKLPDEVITSRPRLLIYQGWVIFLSGKVTQASQILEEAKRALTSLPEDQERHLLQGHLSAMLGTITALSRDITTAIAEAQQALAYLPEDEFIFRARAMRVLGVSYAFQGDMGAALSNLERAKSLALAGQNKFLASEILSQIATTRKHQGKLFLAVVAYQQILNLYERPESAPPACLGYIGLAEIALERNDLVNAEKWLNTGIELSIRGSIGYALQPAYLIEGLLKFALGDQVGALEAIQKGEDLSLIGGGSLESILGLAHFQTRLHLQIGEIEAARGWAPGRLLPPGWSFGELPTVLHEVHQSLLAWVYLASGELDKVLDISARVSVGAEAGGRLARVMELSLFKALALQQLGEPEEALDVFEKSLSLAEPEDYVRLFLEAGDPVIDLLHAAQARGLYAEYVAGLLSVCKSQWAKGVRDADTIPTSEELVEPLTKREMEVLRLMCNGCSNQQIADVLIVSINTVKKHTSNIYGKLGVRNRAQAVLRARDLDLI